jgi:hypothetical protein
VDAQIGLADAFSFLQAAVAHYLGAMQMYEVAPMPDDYAFSPAGHWSEPFRTCASCGVRFVAVTFFLAQTF